METEAIYIGLDLSYAFIVIAKSWRMWKLSIFHPAGLETCSEHTRSVWGPNCSIWALRANRDVYALPRL